MNKWKNRLLLMGMYLSLLSVSLTSCGNKDGSYTYRVDANLKIHYDENNSIEATFTYNQVEDYLKIVTIERKGYQKKYLMLKECYADNYSETKTTKLRYLDLKTGVTMVDYYWNKCLTEEEIKEESPSEIYVGKDLKIIEEQNYIDFLIQNDYIKREYTALELIIYFEENLKEQNEDVKRELMP